MTLEKWIVHPGETRVIDVAAVRSLKAGLAGGQIDIIGHDEPGVRIEVHGVSVKDLRIEVTGDELEIDHPQLRWDNFLEVFRNVGASGPKAEISVAVPRSTALNLGVVTANALIADLSGDARLSTVSGDLLVDRFAGALTVKAVSGDIQVRDLEGTISANSVSGDVAIAGRVWEADVDSVSGTTLIDAEEDLSRVSVNSVSGAVTIRMDEDRPADYVLRSASGHLLVDGVERSSTGPSSYAGSTGSLTGSFAEVRVHTVSADVTVLRRATFMDATALPEASGREEVPEQEETQR